MRCGHITAFDWSEVVQMGGGDLHTEVSLHAALDQNA